MSTSGQDNPEAPAGGDSAAKVEGAGAVAQTGGTALGKGAILFEGGVQGSVNVVNVHNYSTPGGGANDSGSRLGGTDGRPRDYYGTKAEAQIFVNAANGLPGAPDSLVGDRNWDHELQEVSPRWLQGTRTEADPKFETLVEAWPRYRILVIRYARGERKHAELLAQRLAHWSLQTRRSRKVLGAGTYVTASFRDLAAPGHWPEERHGSMIYLHRRNDPQAARFLSMSNGVEVKHLSQRLEDSDCRLVLSLVAEWDADEGVLDALDESIFTLELSSTEPTRFEEGALQSASPFDTVPKLVAGLFPGLPLAEFLELVSEFQPCLERKADSSVPSGGKTKEPKPPPLLTRHQRWTAGEVDEVLKELGIRYEISPTDSTLVLGAQRAPGYYLVDEACSFNDAAWVISNHPALLARHTEYLLTRYLSGRCSERLLESLKPCLARLDSAGIHGLDAALVIRVLHHVIAEGTGIGDAVELMTGLVGYVNGLRPAERRLSSSLLEQLADQAASLELQFQGEIGLEPLLKFSSLIEQGDSPLAASQLWPFLWSEGQTSQLLRQFSDRQSLLVWAMLRMASIDAAESARALNRAIRGVRTDATTWGQLRTQYSYLREVPCSLALNIHRLGNLVTRTIPASWMALVRGTVEAFGEATRMALAGDSAKVPRDATEAGYRLARVWRDSFAETLDSCGDVEKSSLLGQMGLVGESPPDVMEMVGRMLAMSMLRVDVDPYLGPLGEEAQSMGDTVRFLRATAIIIGESKLFAADQSSAAVASIVKGLRAYLPLANQRDLTAAVRMAMDSQLSARDILEAVDDRKALASIRRGIRASRTLIRGIAADRR